MSDDKLKYVLELLGKAAMDESSDLGPEEKIVQLWEKYSEFCKTESFEAGDLVQWKPGLRNKGGLGDDDFAVVVDVLEDPVFDGAKDSGNPYFREPLDLVVAFLDSDDDFIVLHLDSRRLRKVKEIPGKGVIN